VRLGIIITNLSWSHICELITIDDDIERQFYENECIKENMNYTCPIGMNKND
jgi:hypothetical protein